MAKNSLPSDPIPVDIKRAALGGPVHVVIPAEVAFDIERLFEVQRTLFDRLGHGGCYSGANLLLELERNFVVDRKGELRSVGGF
jgi:hypothetical protein